MSNAAAQTTAQSEGNSHKWWALAAVCFGLFMALLDVTIVNVALPTMATDLNASLSDLQWVISAYAIALAVLIVTSARLGDIFGRKKVFMTGLGVFSFGSLLCALSPYFTIGGLSHVDVLNAARVIQGIGSSAMIPLSLAIISSTFHAKERGAAFGIWGGVSGMATAIGPVLGGILVTQVNWQSIFYINIPIGIVGILLSGWAIKESVNKFVVHKIDFFGLITVTVFMFCLILALIQGNDKGWSSTYIITLFVIAAAAFLIFIFGELRMKHPMVDPRLFKNASYTGAAICAFTLSAGLYALFFYLTLYLQNFLGFDALGAGLRFLPLSALVLFTAPLAGRMTDRIGAKPVLFTGLGMITIAVALMTRISPADTAADWVVLLPAFIIAGLGNGLVNPPISSVALGTTKPERAGMASGVNNVCRQIGISFGIAFLGAILSSRYNAYIKSGISALKIDQLSGAIKQKMITGIQQAGTIAGSTGLKGDAAHPNPYASQPFFPQVEKVIRDSFIHGTTDILWWACAMLATGALSALFLIKKSDMLHHEEENANK